MLTTHRSHWLTLFLTFVTGVSAWAQPPLAEASLLTDFKEPDVAKKWITVNDNVMGGRSEGGPTFKDGLLIFSGNTNTNGGGFSSIRTRRTRWKIGNAAGIMFRVRGDGRTYKFDLQTGVFWQGLPVSYRADFETKAGEWTEVRLPFKRFIPTSMGQSVEGQVDELEPAKIATIGFMIYDKQDGPFQLEVDWVKTYQED